MNFDLASFLTANLSTILLAGTTTNPTFQLSDGSNLTLQGITISTNVITNSWSASGTFTGFERTTSGGQTIETVSDISISLSLGGTLLPPAITSGTVPTLQDIFQGDNQLFGGSQNDTLLAIGRNDQLTGGGGDDHLYLGYQSIPPAGSDTVDGGSGWNEAFFNGRSNALTFTGLLDRTTVFSYSGGTDTLTNVEVLKFTDGVSFALQTVAPSDFRDSGTSDILFRNDSTGDTWFEAMSNGVFDGWSPISGSSTSYAVAGIGDFNGDGTADIFYRNSSTGDTWLAAMSNGAFAGWHQIGGSDTHYSVVGVGDFFGDGTSDLLFRNNSTGDTWFEANDGWHPVGGSDTRYSVVGVGDFLHDGTSDILFRNNSTGDMWFEAMNNSVSPGWNPLGGSDTHYSVVGIGSFDFYSDGWSDILFRNNSTGDMWYRNIGSDGWQQVGGSDTNYSVVGVGKYFGNEASDILFRNSSTGDTWFEAMSNGSFNGWSQVGGSNTSYAVKS
jgi:FG-GAP-like repeat/RTX calcium-binding nonapeptide repeat (4 copies)